MYSSNPVQNFRRAEQTQYAGQYGVPYPPSPPNQHQHQTNGNSTNSSGYPAPASEFLSMPISTWSRQQQHGGAGSSGVSADGNGSSTITSGLSFFPSATSATAGFPHHASANTDVANTVLPAIRPRSGGTPTDKSFASAFLEAEAQRRSSNASQSLQGGGGSGFGIDWPEHTRTSPTGAVAEAGVGGRVGQAASPKNGAAPGGNGSAGSDRSRGAADAGGDSVGWLDMLGAGTGRGTGGTDEGGEGAKSAGS